MNIGSRNQSQSGELKLRVKKATLLTFLSLIFYRIVLDLSYYFVISRVWRYEKFVLNLNTLKLAESYLLLFVIFILMPKSSKKLSNIMLWLLILTSYVPMLTFFAFADKPRIYMYGVTGFWIMVFLFFQTAFHLSIPPLKRSQSNIILYLIFICVTAIDIFIIYKYLGFSVNFNLKVVYSIRARYVSLQIPFAEYLFNWTAYIINPMLFAISWIKRKWFFVILSVILQILLFSGTGMKSFLFALPFVLILMWIVTRKNPFTWIGFGFGSGVITGMLSYWLIGDIWISSLFTRRALLVPAQLSFLYYDFFSKNGFIFLSGMRVFREFLKYPYSLDPPHLIGSVYFNMPTMGANNGIVADAYMNFGFVGFILWSVLLVIILKLIDSLSEDKDARLTIATITMSAMSLSNSALSTCLLTHGLLLALILLYLLPEKKRRGYV